MAGSDSEAEAAKIARSVAASSLLKAWHKLSQSFFNIELS